MKSPRLFLFHLIAALVAPLLAPADDGWVSLFDSRTLNGWKASENPGSPQVRDGAIVAEGKRAHLFYVGDDGRAEFENFELELEIKTEPGANSGVYFQTKWQDSGWPGAGFESQVNNTQPPFKEQDYRENKKTASLYGIRNLYKAMARDGEWFTVNIRVARPRVEIRLNGQLVTAYTEPANPVLPSPGPKLNLLGKGTFALQCHDEDSRAYYRNIRVRRLPPGEDTSVTKPVFSEQDLRRLSLGKDNFPIVNLRTQLGDGFTLEQVLALRLETGIGAGIVTESSALANDAAVATFTAVCQDRPVHAGLLADERGWTERLPPQSRARFDYIIGQVGPVATAARWTDEAVRLIENEPVDVLADDASRPELDAAQTARLIAAAAKHGVAFEIGTQRSALTGDFIRQAKAAGVKFAIGSSERSTAANWSDWTQALTLQQEANLGWKDIYMPGHFPTRAQRELAKN